MRWFAPRNIALLVIACAPVVLHAQAGTAANTASGAVQEFIRAIADSNLTRVAQLWGNAKGPAARTHLPKDYEKKIVIMQAMIRSPEIKTLGDVPGENGMRTVTAQLSSHGCTVTIPVNVVKAKEGWLVHDFKLDDAAAVNKPCETGRRPGNPGR